MSDTVIRVENLGKKYIIGRQKSERYTALRDVIANSAKSLGRKLSKPLGKRISDPEIEEFWALKDVSFEIKQGDRVGIIGRNGAGKSTLLKILSRITEPTKGSIRIKGRVASLLEVGTGFHPELTGRENIYLNGAILGMSKFEIKRKFDEIVAFAEVEKFLDTPVKRYSSGMYVRLAFAVAAHLEPEILVVDEVLAVGDAQFQKKCLGKMENVAKEGRTILFVSHNMAAIRNLCNTGCLFKQGKLVLQSDINYIANLYQMTNQKINSNNNHILEIRSDYHHEIKIDYFKIDKVLVTKGNNETICSFKVGDALSIKIHYSSSKKIFSPAFIVTCKTEYAIQIFELHSSPTNGKLMKDIEVGLGYVELVIPSLFLTGGIYYFDLSFARAATQRYFTIEQLIKLTIDPTDVYHTGFPLKQETDLIAVHHQWKIENK